MSFRYDGRGVGHDPERQLRINDIASVWADDYPNLELCDLVTGQTWAFSFGIERKVRPAAREGEHPEHMHAAYRLDRAKMELIAARIAETRRWRGPPLTMEDVLEAVQEGVFIYGTQGGNDLRNPDFEVTYVDASAQASAV